MNTALRLIAASVASSLILLAAGCSSSDDSGSEAADHIARAQTYADQGQYRSAMLEVRNAVQKDSGNVGHVVILANIYNDIGAGEQATELLSPWLEDHRQQVALPSPGVTSSRASTCRPAKHSMVSPRIRCRKAAAPAPAGTGPTARR